MTSLLRLTAVFALFVGTIGCATSFRPIVAKPQPARETIDDGWRFTRADVPAATQPAFDDSGWSAVTLPHTWNVADGSDGGSDYYRGPGWYRRTVRVAARDLAGGNRVYLRFGAASLVADVYVNGTHVGQHRGGFAAFCYDVSGELHAGANVVSVRVDNARVDDVAPQSGDFTVFGGLYRDVQLLVRGPLHISPIDDASPGVYLHPATRPADLGKFGVDVKLRDHRPAEARDAARIDVTVTGPNPAGNVVARATAPVPTDAGTGVDVRASLAVDHPALWNGVDAPALYSVHVRVLDSHGREVDASTQPLGFRAISIDATHGLSLNGTRYAMYGVNVHQEVGGKGWAGAPADYAQTYRLIRELGATTVRMAHYQHNPAEYDLCDQLGLLVWAEIPLVNAYGPSPVFGENLQQQLRELIKQNYNHPSIYAWSLWNEVSLTSKDAKWQIARDCDALAQELDPSRVTTAALNAPPTHGSQGIPDVVAFNRYDGWYRNEREAWPDTLDGLHEVLPTRPIALSEYGAGASVAQHEISPARVKPVNPWHPEEYQALVHETAWAAIKARPWLWASYVWVTFDFSIDSRKEGDHLGRNDKGLIAFDRKTPKDAFYFYQANWTTTPMVHVTSARFDPYPPGRSDVRVYSNCDTVELIQDGRSLGTRRGANGVFVFRDVAFELGRATTVARGTRDGKTIEDRVTRRVATPTATRPAEATPPPATRPANATTTTRAGAVTTDRASGS